MDWSEPLLVCRFIKDCFYSILHSRFSAHVMRKKSGLILSSDKLLANFIGLLLANVCEKSRDELPRKPVGINRVTVFG